MIEFLNVSKSYGKDAFALSEVNLAIAEGEMIYLAGPSGAGKSTLLKLIAAMEKPTSGNIVVHGQDLSKIKAANLPFLRRGLGLILQQQRLLHDRSVLENVMLPLLVSGSGRRDAGQRAAAALEKLGLVEKGAVRPQSLSGGEQQRVLIARAIVNRPKIILADEPTANLDRQSAAKVIAALQAFHTAGVTCIISTHDEHILDAASRVIYLAQGWVVDGWQDGAVTDATHSDTNKKFLATDPLREVSQ